MNKLQQFANQAIIYGVGSILSRIVYYLLVTVFLTYLLGDQTGEFGTYGTFYAYISVLVVILSFRFDTAFFKFGSQDVDFDTAFSTAFVPVVLIALGAVVVGCGFSESIAAILGFEGQSHYIVWVSLILGFDIMNLLPFAKLRLLNRAKAFALYKIFNVALSAILILFFLVLVPRYRDGWLSFIPQLPDMISWVFVANVIASGVLFLSLLPVLKGQTWSVDKLLLRKMVYYSYPLVIIGVANGIVQFFGVPLQQWFLSGDHAENLGQAGIYDATRRIAGLFVMFTTAFNYAAEPFFFNNASAEDRRELYGKICRLFTLVGGLVIVGMVIGIDLLQYLAESTYRESIYLMPVLLVAYLFQGLHINISIWYKLSDNTIYGAYIAIIGALVTLMISITCLSSMGYAASAWATLVSYMLMVVIGYVWGQKHFPIHYPVKHILADLLLIISILAIVHCCQEYMATVRYIVGTALFCLYLLYAYHVERDEWVRMLKR